MVEMTGLDLIPVPDQQTALMGLQDFDTSRAIAEVQAALVIARANPRNEEAFLKKMIARVDSSKTFCEKALYTLPRKNRRSGELNEIVGESVHMAREMARLWGNLQVEAFVVRDDEETRTYRYRVWDMETNTSRTQEIVVLKRVQRFNRETRKTEWITPDENELLLRINNVGARVERNLTFNLIPREFIDAVKDRILQCEHKNTAVNQSTIVAMVDAYKEVGVSEADLEAHLGHPTALINQDEMTELRLHYRTIARDGGDPKELLDNQTVDVAAEKPTAAEPELWAAPPAAPQPDPTPPPPPKPAPPAPPPQDLNPEPDAEDDVVPEVYRDPEPEPEPDPEPEPEPAKAPPVDDPADDDPLHDSDVLKYLQTPFAQQLAKFAKPTVEEIAVGVPDFSKKVQAKLAVESGMDDAVFLTKVKQWFTNNVLLALPGPKAAFEESKLDRADALKIAEQSKGDRVAFANAVAAL